MASLNKVILIGNLGKDPEVRVTASGQTMANFSLATKESFKNKEGKREERIIPGQQPKKLEKSNGTSDNFMLPNGLPVRR